MTRSENMPGAFRLASAPIIALTECPTNTASFNSRARPISTTSSA
jgi:hypothetical protein